MLIINSEALLKILTTCKDLNLFDVTPQVIENLVDTEKRIDERMETESDINSEGGSFANGCLLSDLDDSNEVKLQNLKIKKNKNEYVLPNNAFSKAELSEIKTNRTKRKLISYNCSECNFQTKNRNKLQSHKAKNHPKSRKLDIYKCKKCDFTANSSRKVSSHMNFKHPTNQMCTICGAIMNTLYYKKHMVTHDETGKEKITCPICGKVFKNFASYLSHPMMHVEEENICETCGKKFTIKGEYVRHLRNHRGWYSSINLHFQ